MTTPATLTPEQEAAYIRQGARVERIAALFVLPRPRLVEMVKKAHREAGIRIVAGPQPEKWSKDELAREIADHEEQGR